MVKRWSKEMIFTVKAVDEQIVANRLWLILISRKVREGEGYLYFERISTRGLRKHTQWQIEGSYYENVVNTVNHCSLKCLKVQNAISQTGSMYKE